MHWGLEFTAIGMADLVARDRPIQRQILDRLVWLAENFEHIKLEPLHAEWKDYFKLRVGDWRVAYTFDVSKKVIKVHRIDRRDKVYKRR